MTFTIICAFCGTHIVGSYVCPVCHPSKANPSKEGQP